MLKEFINLPRDHIIGTDLVLHLYTKGNTSYLLFEYHCAG